MEISPIILGDEMSADGNGKAFKMLPFTFVSFLSGSVCLKEIIFLSQRGWEMDCNIGDKK